MKDTALPTRKTEEKKYAENRDSFLLILNENSPYHLRRTQDVWFKSDPCFFWFKSDPRFQLVQGGLELDECVCVMTQAVSSDSSTYDILTNDRFMLTFIAT